MSIPCDKTFLLIPSSRSLVKVKVKYKKKMAFAGALVFHEHSLLDLLLEMNLGQIKIMSDENCKQKEVT